MKKITNKGQALIEYVLIVSLITVIAISIVRLFGGYLKDAITKSSCPLLDQIYVEGDTPGHGYCSEKSEDDNDPF